MPSQQLEHVIKEADSGSDLGHAGTIKVHRHLDVSLFSLSLDSSGTHERGFP
jgi:hypothetical protein